ncbi:hypothetical protein HNP88_000658 [Methanococcus maripaludis]|uniref:Uncharacterized protein n=1 Tax=Methanococcus maripaludis TaxID=39152 RepID=A0A7J9NM29_METMI|nr:hypothetical protein [Methanococcus maripaludis]MBA2846474.1 hypothetical protein [Methanococcus maripaludis]
MDTSWLLSGLAILFAFYGILDESVKRNMKYIFDPSDKLFMKYLWGVFLLVILYESVIRKLADELLKPIYPDNSLSAIGFVFFTFLGLFLRYKVNTPTIYDITGFFNNLTNQYNKKEYSIVLTDLNRYYDKILKNALRTPLMAYLSIKVLHKTPKMVHRETLISFLDITTNDYDYVSEMGKKYPELAFKLLDSKINFKKSNFWNNYSRYLFSNKNSELYVEINKLKPKRYSDMNDNSLKLDYGDTRLLKAVFNGNYNAVSELGNIITQIIQETGDKSCSNVYFDMDNSPIRAALVFYDLYIRDNILKNSDNSLIISPIPELTSGVINLMELNKNSKWYYEELEDCLILIFDMYDRWIYFSKKDNRFGLLLTSRLPFLFWNVMTSKINVNTKREIYDRIKIILDDIDENFEDTVKEEYFKILFEKLNILTDHKKIKRQYNSPEEVKELFSSHYEKFIYLSNNNCI